MGVRDDSADRGGAGPEDRQKVLGLVTEPQGMCGATPKGRWKLLRPAGLTGACVPDGKPEAKRTSGVGGALLARNFTQELLLRFPCSEKRPLQVTLLGHSI